MIVGWQIILLRTPGRTQSVWEMKIPREPCSTPSIHHRDCWLGWWGGVGHWYQISHSWMRGGVSTLCSSGFGVPSLFCEFAKLNKSSGQMQQVFKKHTITDERHLFPRKYQINLWMMEMLPAAHLITPLIKSQSAHKRWLINFHNLRGHNLHKFS